MSCIAKMFVSLFYQVPTNHGHNGIKINIYRYTANDNKNLAIKRDGILSKAKHKKKEKMKKKNIEKRKKIIV